MASQSTVKETHTLISTSNRGSNIATGSGNVTENEDASPTYSDFHYKSNISPRSSNLARTSASFGSGGSGGASYKRTVEITSGRLPTYASLNSNRVCDVKSTREKEKKAMQNLNERFASYIEKTRFLEAQNRKLVDELEELKSNWGKETGAIKVMYETDLKEARDVLEETNKDKNKLEVRLQGFQVKIDDLNVQ